MNTTYSSTDFNEKNTTSEGDHFSKEDMMAKGSEVYEKTVEAATDAYEKTAQVASDTYEQARVYTRENPEKVSLIAFGVGFGLGMLLCSRPSRTSRSAHAVVDALYDVAHAFLK